MTVKLILFAFLDKFRLKMTIKYCRNIAIAKENLIFRFSFYCYKLFTLSDFYSILVSYFFIFVQIRDMDRAFKPINPPKKGYDPV